ncbi:MAG TPA: alpha-amylase family glycosyl hydrolase [Ruminiclostridium sp.]|nr:alpha-amylase family glycosyl hydrolase [Ruminiclostridium sp.]
MPRWLEDAVFYEVYPQSFYDTNGDGIGDINGIAEKLPYIKSLGCNAVWINPCFDSPFKDAGYDVRDYKKVAQRYGTNKDLYNLFEAAHKLGVKILLDLVPGHTSEEHEWFKKSALPEKNEYSNRFIWTDSIWTSPNEYKCIGGRADRNGNYIVNFFSTQPALNYGFYKVTADWQLSYDHPDCIATKEAMKDIMRFWLDKGCDGFRVDMAASLVKNDDEKIATSLIWRDVRNMLDSDYPEAALVSEWSCPEKSLKCGFHCDFYLNQKDNGYESLFRNKSSRTKDTQLSFFSKEGKGDISKFTEEYMRKYTGSKDCGYISFLTCNHDTARLAPEFGETELKIAYAFIFTMPGVPFLYYGDEIGMRYNKNLTSKEGGYDRTGTRTPMQWDNSTNLGFSSASPDKLYLPVDSAPDAPTVQNQSGHKDSLFNTVKEIIGLRHKYNCLKSGGSFEIVYAEKDNYPFIYRRGNLTIAVNPSGRRASAPLGISGKIIYSIGDEPGFTDGSIEMSAQSFAILEV